MPEPLGSQSGPGGDTDVSQGILAPPGPGSAELASATRTAIVAYAKQFLGNPYVYGGTSLAEGSGLLRLYDEGL